MGLERHPIQNSEVYVLNAQSRPAPPSPPTPCETRAISPIPDKLMTIAPAEIAGNAPLLDTRLTTAVHVLKTEAKALSYISRLYQTDSIARRGFNQAVDLVRRTMEKRGKLVVCGVGKSGHIAKKLVATMNSLSISATFLHPTEALHGDLGMININDTILFITFSGRTPELLSLVQHLNPQNALIVMTAHTHPSTCPIIDQRPDAVLLPAPIQESEVESFGVCAPTTSTTIALALGDALTLAISGEMHTNVADVFANNHPGGAIGHDVLTPQAKKEALRYSSVSIKHPFRRRRLGLSTRQTRHNLRLPITLRLGPILREQCRPTAAYPAAPAGGYGQTSDESAWAGGNDPGMDSCSRGHLGQGGDCVS